MASNGLFTTVETVLDSRPRSSWRMDNEYIAPVYHGDLFLIDLLEVIPGDSAKYDIDGFIRTATPPIAPFMTPVWCSVAAFFVPERLVWDKEKEFMGENKEGYGIQTPVYQPRGTKKLALNKSEILSNPQAIATYGSIVAQNPSITYGSEHSPIAVNPIRCFLQVYNDWFRNENFMAPYLWDHSQTGDSASINFGTLNGVSIDGKSSLPKVCKKMDRFTSCLPWAQKGLPVLLPLGESAPVYGVKDTGLNALDFMLEANYQATSSSPIEKGLYKVLGEDYDGVPVHLRADSLEGDQVLETHGLGSLVRIPTKEYLNSLGINSSMVADLSQARAASVNELRFAFATQRYFEALARGGSKYRETIYSLYGVSIGDTTAQMAEFLGGMTFNLNIDQVTQTTGYSAGQGTELGAPGAVSLTAGSDHVFAKSFAEPGYIVLVGYTKHLRSYGQGLEEFYQKNEILQRYNPKFAFIGEQPILTNSIYFDGSASKDGDSFGFQEAFSDYRMKRDVTIGALNPSVTNSLDFWTLTDNYASAPTLNADFLTEDRNNISRCLSGGLASPDYIVDFKINRLVAREMPVHSTPGYIDHF